ncbi:MAG: NADH-quinone oxidoreductase subunit L [Crocinitomicaceae bacterium]
MISIALVVSASIKSAQFPFSSWLPRAMEGPTPSSAIFYGSIAVHIGVFLLLRTYPFWSDLTVIKIGVIVLGLFTSFIATISSRVQSSIKAQIAYSSVAQIGLIFVEVALGLEMIALIHLTGNAFLRSYQLLISPSVVTYLIREQFFNYAPVKERKKKTWTRIITNSFYVIGLKEWHMDNNLYRFFWYPLKRVGYLTTFLTTLNSSIFTLIVIVGSFFILNTEAYEHLTIQRYIPVLFGLIGLLFVLRAFTDRGSSTLAWTLLTLNHFWIVLAVAFNERFDTMDIVFYLSGVLIASISGYIVLHLLRKKEKFDLNNFYGHATEHKALGFYFLLSCLALAGFPITSTFLGEDLLFTHIHEDQIFLAILISINFVVTGIAVIRMYSRIFMGPNRKWYQPNARRSA